MTKTQQLHTAVINGIRHTPGLRWDRKNSRGVVRDIDGVFVLYVELRPRSLVIVDAKTKERVATFGLYDLVTVEETIGHRGAKPITITMVDMQKLTESAISKMADQIEGEGK